MEAMDKLYLREISSMEWSDRTLSAASGSLSGSSGSTGGGGAGGHVSGAPGGDRALTTALDVQSTFSFLFLLPGSLRAYYRLFCILFACDQELTLVVITCLPTNEK